jgi:hypothetical protein
LGRIKKSPADLEKELNNTIEACVSKDEQKVAGWKKT